MLTSILNGNGQDFAKTLTTRTNAVDISPAGEGRQHVDAHAGHQLRLQARGTLVHQEARHLQDAIQLRVLSAEARDQLAERRGRLRAGSSRM